MSKILAVQYSIQALENAEEIVKYLRNSFSEKEINSFFEMLKNFEKIIVLYPKIYPQSNQKKLRKAVLSKVLSVYYLSKENNIYVVAILDNRWQNQL